MLVSMIVAMSFFSCAGKRPDHLGVDGARLAPCPRSPNCVSSDADPGDAQHGIEPLALASEPAEAWQTVRDVVARMPRTKIQTESDGYLHAECSSALMGYVDDLELHLRASDGLIAVRSASRVGYGDMGVNRKRVETLRARLAERGAVR
jgi:uncharacterized protein (DUF1499 family)